MYSLLHSKNRNYLIFLLLLSVIFSTWLVVESNEEPFLFAIHSLLVNPDWTAEGNQDLAFFGSAVGSAGDVNGDEFDDIIIGAKDYENGQQNEGQVFVYYGNAGGLPITATWTVDGNQTDSEFGSAVGSAGDVNGDGFSDVIIGDYYYDDDQLGEGRALVYHGSDSGLSTSPDWVGEGNQNLAYFGASVNSAGDVNGDGYDDVIVGAPDYSNGQSEEGRAFVYYGSANGLSTTADWTAESNQNEAAFGWSVATAGDVNNDGFSDVIISAPFYDDGQPAEGRVYVFHGSAGGLPTMADWVFDSDQDYAEFGWSVRTAGDVNSDGYSDVIIGANNQENDQSGEGQAFVFHGSPDGLSTIPDWTAEGNQEHAEFGISVSAAGDVNNDGHSDVIVGARYYDNGENAEGRAFVYYGSAMGLALNPDWTAESDQSGAEFGYSVSTAGDVNGDDFSDVVIGAPNFENGQPYEGRAYVYHGQTQNPTPTYTPTKTSTSTSTPVDTPTKTPTNTPGHSPTPTATSPVTITATNTPSATKPPEKTLTPTPTSSSPRYRHYVPFFKR